MNIYWKALVGYGFVFWIVLCLTDILGVTHLHQYKENLDDLYETPPVVLQHLEQTLEHQGIKFGWSLVVWNTLTFTLSIIICSLLRNGVLIARNLLRTRKLEVHSPSQPSAISKIPVVAKRKSDSTLLPLKKSINLEQSCPNLLQKRSGSTLSCNTTPRQPNDECKRLKQELHRLQTVSLKEHAILSRKLDGSLQEQEELTRHLALSKKENRAAKQQLQELLQEKGQLIRRLDSATKEFKSNTKAKKLALAKLQDVSGHAEELRQQLEQVTRDKEILEKKLRLLESEFNKLHERFLMANQQKSAAAAEPDPDMQRIQDKIKQLERNLDSFHSTPSTDLLPSELSTSESLPRVSPTGYWSDKVADLISRNKRQFAKIHELAVKMQEKARWLGGRRQEDEEEEELGSSDLDEEPKRLVSSSQAFKDFLKSLNKLDAAKREPSSNSEVYF